MAFGDEKVRKRELEEGEVKKYGEVADSFDNVQQELVVNSGYVVGKA